MMSMYAIVKTGGKQYRVFVGGTLRVELLDAEVGSEVVFREILLYKSEDGKIDVGRPFLSDIIVKATVTAVGRGPKIHIFKMRRRKHYKKSQGHRQAYTELSIDYIGS